MDRPTRTAVARGQRCSRRNPCAVCGGGHDDPRGIGVRCYGYYSDDGEIVFCTREDRAGDLSPTELSDGQEVWAHRLVGGCPCGQGHGEDPPEFRVPMPNKRPSSFVAEYIYRDAQGLPKLRVVRTADKQFFQQHPDGSGACCRSLPRSCSPADDGWAWGAGGAEPLLYRLPEVSGADPARPVVVVEGEKDVETLEAFGVLATCNSGGAGKWRREHAAVLRGRDVIIIPDADGPGFRHAQQVASSLHGTASTVKIVELPGAKDVSEFIAAGHSIDDLRALVAATPPRQPLSPPSGLVIVDLANVTPRPVTWLWDDRIPVGKFTLFDGDPGSGKSWLTMAIATAVTTGRPLPGETTRHPPASVLILSAEDGPEDTIRPRLEDLGADLELAKVLVAVREDDGRERHFSLQRDVDRLNALLEEGGYALVIVDPLNAYLGGAVDTHRDASVRDALTPLIALAARHDVAVVGVRHFTKSGREKPMYRGQGSIAYTAAARVVHLIGPNPKVDGERLMVCAKNNLALPPPALGFAIVDGKWQWLGLRPDITAEELLAPPKAATKQQQAEDFLMDFLAEGPRPQDEVLNAWGGSEGTLKRAKRPLGVQSVREGEEGRQGGGRWIWQLPDELTEPLPTVDPGVDTDGVLPGDRVKEV